MSESNNGIEVLKEVFNAMVAQIARGDDARQAGIDAAQELESRLAAYEVRADHQMYQRILGEMAQSLERLIEISRDGVEYHPYREGGDPFDGD